MTNPFHTEVEPDEDAWHAYCPALEKCGAATRDEAMENIRQVIELVVADLLEAGE